MKEEISKLMQYFLTLINIDNFEVDVVQPDSITYKVHVKGLNDRDTALLIGKQGDNLHALQYIFRLVARAKFDLEHGADRYITIDVMDYRQRQIDNLTVLAKKKAREALETGKDIPLEPMSAFERRIIHMALKDDPQIATTSTGEGRDRRVTIKVLNEPIKIELG
ncbi:protein jag [Patescibacteria group bacterium]|nr:protein jag [Patescibacteria group bacterium]